VIVPTILAITMSMQLSRWVEPHTVGSVTTAPLCGRQSRVRGADYGNAIGEKIVAGPLGVKSHTDNSENT
jgi:hypothetical protein